ncbi:hypothetical protein CBM2597_U30121 [Cupriavidus taiwanensis]|uniref:Uncharacterized protein n=1 Tax=Cupriavidus taiwanensis TaxID=164546 RepID=A0A7Z7JFX4_9BURK|nr:hypothetical protein CBM2597_U30121 [Cupriavidus taiwanensis]SPC25856.1 hypothetical protein CBM2594_U20043 [Cupriavidus taiwanensis]
MIDEGEFGYPFTAFRVQDASTFAPLGPATAVRWSPALPGQSILPSHREPVPGAATGSPFRLGEPKNAKPHCCHWQDPSWP